jgi:hypothetical protein
MVTFHLEEVPSNGGRVTSEVIFRDLDRRGWPSGAPIARNILVFLLAEMAE